MFILTALQYIETLFLACQDLPQDGDISSNRALFRSFISGSKVTVAFLLSCKNVGLTRGKKAVS